MINVTMWLTDQNMLTIFRIDDQANWKEQVIMI